MSDEFRIQPTDLDAGAPFDARLVIGEEDRLQVRDTTVRPFCSIAQLIALNASGHEIAYGTGWFAHASVVITAAHVIATAASIRVIPGHNLTAPNPQPFGQVQTSRFQVAPTWNGQEGDQSDYAAVFVAPVNLPPFRPGVFDNAAIPRLNVNITGYPMIPPEQAPLGTQWGALGKVQATSNPQLLVFDIDMTPGQSGSPLLVFVQNEYYVAGINVAEVVAPGGPFNMAVRMTNSVQAQIAQWVAQAST